MKHLTIVLLAAGAAALSHAKTCVWKGGTLGSKNYQYWSVSNNWEDAAVPVSGDSVAMTNSSGNTYVICNDIGGLEIADLDFVFDKTVAGGCDLTLLGRKLTIGGTANFLLRTNVVDKTGTFRCYWQFPLEMKSSATKFDVYNEGTLLFDTAGVLSGDGTVTKTGPGTMYFNYDGDDFNGTIEIRQGTATSQGASSSNPFGSSNCVVNVYGPSCPDGAGTSGAINFYSPDVDVVCKIESYDSAGITTWARVSFWNQVTVHKYRSASGSTAKFSAYYDSNKAANTMPGYVFHGDLTVEDGAKFGFYNSCSGRFKTEFLGESVYLGTLTSLPMNNNNGSTGGNVCIGSPITTGASSFDLDITPNQKYYLLKPNVLPGKTKFDIGRNDYTYGTTNALVDFCGCDQSVGTLTYNDNKGALTNEVVFTSSTGPATLSFGTVGAASYRKLPYLNGRLSVKMYTTVNQTSSNPYRACGGDTTGWLMSDWPLDLTGAEFPNLSGIDMRQTDVTGAAKTENPYVKIATDTVLNSNMQFDLHDLGKGRLYVQTGAHIAVGSVLLDNVDQAAGTYCRVASDAATLADAWLGYTGTASSWNGTVTIAEHDPIAIWTGGGANNKMTMAANWADGKVPDFTNANLTLDLRRAGTATIIRPQDCRAQITNGPYVFGANPKLTYVGFVLKVR